ncbi:putative protein N(5)-glutamine methyltransferase [Streptomyces otsuchiensis]|uniref:putative protein N(5)-glutamine methyltransferase n=1 Tax=Streptomyces otsuchiensis TaxID=2681388 RepID=UPI001D13106D|nr:putative protein N(5)-glutamine methyltransferase [Streptomyces otsuchiensis]
MPLIPLRLPPPAWNALVDRLRAAGCVFAEDEARLLCSAADTTRSLDRLVARRAAGHPLEQVIGYSEFGGLRITVRPGVFVPRRRTEFLARLAADAVRPGTVIAELCCGTGAVGAVIAHAADGPVVLHATDLDPVAVACARDNLADVGGHAHLGDLYEPLPAELRGAVDIVIANAPYVPTGEIPLLPTEARLHEPRAALDGGHDGLDIQRRLIAEAPRWLAPYGKLFVETSARQAAGTAAACQQAGLRPSVAESEPHDATVVIARRGAPPAT